MTTSLMCCPETQRESAAVPTHVGWYAARLARIAAELKDRELTQEELIREGWIALGEARRQWHPNMAVSFLDYAEDRIRCRLIGSLQLRHKGLIWAQAITFKRYGIEEDELVSEGQFSLRRAILGFDPKRGFRFCTYATNAIQNDFRRMLTKHKIRQRAHANVDPARLASNPTETWDEGAPARDRALTLVTTAVAALPERWALVVKMRYGLDGSSPMHLTEVAKVLGVTKERIRQIQNQALRRMKAAVAQSPVSSRSDSDD